MSVMWNRSEAIAGNALVSDVRIEGQNASVIVALGATKQSRHRLALSLVNEANSWKTSKVRPPAAR